MRMRVVSGILMVVALGVTGCGKRSDSKVEARVYFQNETLSVESVARDTARLEQAMVQVLESFAAERADSTLDPAIEAAGHEDRSVAQPLTSQWLQVGRVVSMSPSARIMSYASSYFGGRSVGSSPVPHTQLRSLQDELTWLQGWGWAMQQLSTDQRRPLQQAWAQAEPRLRELAARIVDSNARSADEYAPVLSELLNQVKTLQSRTV
jgi:hypothetical protein